MLKLKKALYGLKQAPRQWYRKLRAWLLDRGWLPCNYDECVFLHKTKHLILTIYVDDLNIFGPDENTVLSFRDEISNGFRMTDAGNVAYYLGIQVERTRQTVRLHQEGFARQIINRYNFSGSRSVATPVNTALKYEKEDSSDAAPSFRQEFMSKTGSMNYLQSKTRPDLAFPVSLVSRYMQNPNTTHMDAIDRQYAYLIGTSNHGLTYSANGSAEIEGFVDSDWGGCKDTGRSTTGWIFTLAGAPISWCSQRQKTVSSSSTEAEYIAASDACKEAIWLNGFKNEMLATMGLPDQLGVTLNIDNASTIKITKNPEFHGRTKHIDIRHHFIRECVEEMKIIPQWTSGKENPADMLTKALPKQTLEKYRDFLRISGPDSTTQNSTAGAVAPAAEGEIFSEV